MDNYLQRIQSVFPEPIAAYQIFDGGWTNIVVEVNGKWIFRFVRDARNTQISVERDFLPAFEAHSPVAIPHLVWDGEDFIAYRKIEGERFSPEKFAQFSTARKRKISKQLGGFLTSLHEFQFPHRFLAEAPYGGSDFWQDLWPLVSPQLSDETRAKAERFFTEVIAYRDAEPFPLTITHSDLGTNNILVDFSRNHLGGIIDFGDMCLADPAVDFAGFYRHFGRAFVEEMLGYYERPLSTNFWHRIEYESRRKSFFVVYFAHHYGFQSYIPGIIEYIESQFQAKRF